MKTIIEDMTAGIDEDVLRCAGEILKGGGLVAFPTETVYGLGANALDAEAAAKIYAAKGRPSDNPLIVHIAEIEDLDAIAKEVSEKGRALAKIFWPGPLTMIFRKSENVPYGTTGGLDTVAIRMPEHPIARAVIRAGGGYIAAPSANTSGRPSPTTAAHVVEDLAGKVEMILDGGSVGIGLESTIVDLSEAVPTILRPGYITKEQLEDVVGEVKVDPGLLSSSEDVKPKAPGMKYKHYAPRAELTIIQGKTDKVAEKINELIVKADKAGEQIGVICTDETKALYQGGVVKSIGSIYDEITIAQHLYAVLREFDQVEVSKIYSEALETPKMGQAIMNRLMKAAGYQILKV